MKVNRELDIIAQIRSEVMVPKEMTGLVLVALGWHPFGGYTADDIQFA